MPPKNKYKIIKEYTYYKIAINDDIIDFSDDLSAYDIQHIEILITFSEKLIKEVYEIQD